MSLEPSIQLAYRTRKHQGQQYLLQVDNGILQVCRLIDSDELKLIHKIRKK